MHPDSHEANLGEAFFAEVLDRFGDRPALIDEAGTTLSYRDLARQADAFARGLGDSPRLVMIETVNEIAPLVAYIGALRGRHPVILTAPDASTKDRRILDTYCPDVVYRKEADGWATIQFQNVPSTRFHGDLAVLLSTSGSTGDAKLVRLSRENIDTNARSIAEYLRLDAGDRAATSLPWHYSYGLSVVNSYLARGAALLLTERSVVEKEFWSFFREHGGTSFAGVPHTFDLLDRIAFTQAEPPATLRYMTLAGGRLDPARILAFGLWAAQRRIELFVMYGQTEAAPRMAYLPPHLATQHPDCIGVPVPGGAFRLVDENGSEVQTPGEVGQLVYRGPNVMMGYALNRDDLAKGPGLSELMTGDLACRDETGLYRIVGRVSRFSKLFGLRINLDDVERFVHQKGVRAAVAGDDETIAVFALDDADPDRLAAELVEKFGLNRTSVVVLKGGDYPLLRSGKIDYRAILRRASEAKAKAQPRTEAVHADARATVPTSIRKDFAYILGRTAISDHDSFVGLGGDSLSYVQISLAIEERLGYLPEGWEELTVAQLEGLARDRSGSRPSTRPDPASATLETDIFLRALAIMGVVATHAQVFDVRGGAYLLLIFAGYNFARFQRTKLWSGQIMASVAPFLLRILIPYYGILAIYGILHGNMQIHRVLLASTFFSDLQSEKGILPYFWFIESVSIIVLAFAGLFLIAPFRRFAAEKPWQTGLVLLVATMPAAMAQWFFGADFASPETWNRGLLSQRVPYMIIYMFVFGWGLYFTKSLSQKAVMTAFALVLFSYNPIPSVAIWLVAGSLAALWVPSLVVVPPVKLVFSKIAASSFYIFLVHMVPVQVVLYGIKSTSLPLTLAAFTTALLLGIGLGWGVRQAESLLTTSVRALVLRMQPGRGRAAA